MKLFDGYKGLRKEMYILFIGRVMTNMGSMIWPMFTLILSRKLGFGAADIAKYMLLFSLISLPVSLIGGRLADKINKRNIIIVCDCVSIAAYVYCYFVPVTIYSIMVFAAASLFQRIERPAYDALVADFTTSENRERAYSLSYMGANLGMVLSPTIGGMLFNEHLNLAFLISGLSIALSTVLIAMYIRDIHRESDESKTASYEKEIDSNASAFSYIFKNRVILMFIICMALTEIVYSMFNYLMPLDMSTFHGDRGAVLFGSITSINAIMVVTCTPIMTVYLSWIMDVNRILAAELFFAGGYLVFASCVTSVPMCYVAIIIFTAGEIMNTLSSKPFLTRRIPASHRGRIISIELVAGGIASAIAEIVIGSAYDSYGSKAAWSIVIGLCLLAALSICLMKYFDRRDHPFMYENR